MKKSMKARIASAISALAAAVIIMAPMMVSAAAVSEPTIPATVTNRAGSGIMPVTFYGIGLLILLGILVFTFLPKKKRENM